MRRERDVLVLVANFAPIEYDYLSESVRSPLGATADPKDEMQEIKVIKDAGPNQALPIGHKTKLAYLNFPGGSDAEPAAGESMRLDRIANNDVPVAGIHGKRIYDSHQIIHFHNHRNSIQGLEIDGCNSRPRHGPTV